MCYRLWYVAKVVAKMVAKIQVWSVRVDVQWTVRTIPSGQRILVTNLDMSVPSSWSVL